MDNKLYILDKEFPIVFLDCKHSFNNLSVEEQKYAYSLIRAGWNGALIDLLQCSAESPGLFLISQAIFRQQRVSEIQCLIMETLKYTEEDADDFLNYFVMIYDNLGNYKSFGDSKFIPKIDEGKFHNIIQNTNAYKNDLKTQNIYNTIKNSIFHLSSRSKQLGLGADGISTYYSYNCTMDDAKFVQDILDKKHISAYNTRLFKIKENDKIIYEVRQASSQSDKKEILHQDGNCIVYLVNGDYLELIQLMVDELLITKDVALNNLEKEMINCYIESFKTGSVDKHKDGSRYWIRDKGPIVENYVGFIETYRDPLGVRAEFEAFIAVVNKKMTERFNTMVCGAPKILENLPWSKEYEKDKFLKPDFTSLDIINFPNSGMPVGINIPNYGDIRQDEGFKNVSLGNVLKARFQDPKTTFLEEDDKQIYISNAADAFDIQVGLHELIGHGSGKLFYKKDGKYNFDTEKTKDILTDGEIKSWYNDFETWESKFTNLSSPYEECRAECVGLYLCSLPFVLEIFGLVNDKEKAQNVVYTNWLSMVRSGMISMEFYTPEQQRWRQAHCEARFAILRVLIKETQNLIKLERVKGENGKPDIVIHLDRSRIESEGRPAIGKFLKMLQYYKSTGNFVEAEKFFKNYSILDEEFLELRKIIMDRKLPRGVTIQCVVTEEMGDGGICVKEYPTTKAGMIESFIDRFSGKFGCSAEEALYAIWSRDLDHYKL